jgi:hypothetical protein
MWLLLDWKDRLVKIVVDLEKRDKASFPVRFRKHSGIGEPSSRLLPALNLQTSISSGLMLGDQECLKVSNVLLLLNILDPGFLWEVKVVFPLHCL